MQINSISSASVMQNLQNAKINSNNFKSNEVKDNSLNFTGKFPKAAVGITTVLLTALGIIAANPQMKKPEYTAPTPFVHGDFQITYPDTCKVTGPDCIERLKLTEKEEAPERPAEDFNPVTTVPTTIGSKSSIDEKNEPKPEKTEEFSGPYLTGPDCIERLKLMEKEEAPERPAEDFNPVTTVPTTIKG